MWAEDRLDEKVPSNLCSGMSRVDENDSVSRVEPHLALVISGLLFVWVAIRAMVVGGLNPTVALAILAESDVLHVGLGLLVSTYSLILLGLLFVANKWVKERRRKGEDDYFAQVARAGMALLFVTTAPWKMVAGAAGGFALGWLVGKWRRRWRKQRRVADRPFMEPEAAAALFVSVLVLSTPMWLPAEMITTSSGSEVGYVLNIDNGWASVLLADKPEVVRLAALEIKERTVCESGRPQASLLSLTLGKSRLPDCPAQP